MIVERAGCVRLVSLAMKESFTAVWNFRALIPYPTAEDVVKTYLTNLATKTWMLLLGPALLIAYPVVRVVFPALVRAVVPEVVYSVLSVI